MANEERLSSARWNVKLQHLAGWLTSSWLMAFSFWNALDRLALKTDASPQQRDRGRKRCAVRWYIKSHSLKLFMLNACKRTPNLNLFALALAFTIRSVNCQNTSFIYLFFIVYAVRSFSFISISLCFSRSLFLISLRSHFDVPASWLLLLLLFISSLSFIIAELEST